MRPVLSESKIKRLVFWKRLWTFSPCYGLNEVLGLRQWPSSIGFIMSCLLEPGWSPLCSSPGEVRAAELLMQLHAQALCRVMNLLLKLFAKCLREKPALYNAIAQVALPPTAFILTGKELLNDREIALSPLLSVCWETQGTRDLMHTYGHSFWVLKENRTLQENYFEEKEVFT